MIRAIVALVDYLSQEVVPPLTRSEVFRVLFRGAEKLKNVNVRTRNTYTLVGGMGFLAFVLWLVLGLHVGGNAIVQIGKYSQLLGAFIGGTLAIVAVNSSRRRGEQMEPWLGREQLAWTLIGAGCIMWGIGECFWRYFLSQGLQPFPSLADIGYSSLPPLVFLGLLLQPNSGTTRKRVLVLLDSLISMGAILAIAWFLLLGSLAQASAESALAKFLGLYYPITDMALLSCILFLLMRSEGRVYQATARRISLLVMGVGLCVFAASDFFFNILNNAGTYVDGTWVDLGWPYGMMIIGVAAYLRRYLPGTSSEIIEQRVRQRAERVSFGPAQIIPYVLLGILFIALAYNVLSSDPAQASIRPVLVYATLLVVALVVFRQILTQMDNERLARRQAIALDRLEVANNRIEEQARQIAERNANLEEGIAHLKEVQAQIANGNLKARARLNSGELMSLAGSLNLMADRWMRFEQSNVQGQRISKALVDLCTALERYRAGARLMIPSSCTEFPEIQRLLYIMGVRPAGNAQQLPSQPFQSPPVTPRQAPVAPRRAGSGFPSSPGLFPQLPDTTPGGLNDGEFRGQGRRSQSGPLTDRLRDDAARREGWKSS